MKFGKVSKTKDLNEYDDVRIVGKTFPDNEAPRQVKVEKTQCLCGFRDFLNRINLPLYTKFTPIGAKNGAETKKSHNLRNEWAVP